MLGGVFLYGQGSEYARLIDQELTISRDVFGSSFFTLTGFHGFHVFLGLIAILIVLGLALAGDFKAPESPAVAAVGIYWHFVDAVWIVVFSVVYIGAVI